MPAVFHCKHWRHNLASLRATYVDFSDYLPGKKSTSDSRYQGDFPGDNEKNATSEQADDVSDFQTASAGAITQNGYTI